MTLLQHLLSADVEKKRASWMDMAIHNAMCKGASGWALVPLASAGAAPAASSAATTSVLAAAATDIEAVAEAKKCKRQKVDKTMTKSITDMLLG